MVNKKEPNQEAVHCSLTVSSPATAYQLLADTSGLPKGRIKDAMVKGAVWLKREGKKERRLRKAKYGLKNGDLLQLYYDPQILAQSAPEPYCIEENQHYSVWFKPPWLLSQGSRYGDHCSLLRIAEKTNRNIDYKLIHRLDREASGLMILAHGSKSAHLLSELFQKASIVKRYFAEIYGTPAIPGEGLKLTTPIDDKSACTEILTCLPGKSGGTSLLDILLHSGRLHQIRRHLADWGHPVVGDPQYGEIGKTRRGEELRLCAWQLSFISPFDQKQKYYQVSQRFLPAYFKSLLSKIQANPDKLTKKKCNYSEHLISAHSDLLE